MILQAELRNEVKGMARTTWFMLIERIGHWVCELSGGRPRFSYHLQLSTILSNLRCTLKLPP